MPFLCVVVGALAETARRHVPAKSRHRAELAAEWSRLDNTFNRSLEAIARRARHSDTHDHSWFQWEPTWACPSDELVGEFGDGVKWVCGLRDLVAPCVVYSFGSGGSAQFEQAILRHTECEVHTFDPTARAPDANAAGLQFHSFGLGARDRSSRLTVKEADGEKRAKPFPVLTLPLIMRTLNHSFVDLLKLDIEGAEAAVVAQLHRDLPNRWPVGQVQMEVHSNRVGGRRALHRMFDQLESRGMHIFHKEVNVQSISCCEYAWVQVAPRCSSFSGRPLGQAKTASGAALARAARHAQPVAVSYPWARLLPETCSTESSRATS